MRVLDKGHVELVDSMGNDAMVANAARVSFNQHKEEFDEKDEKLIKYLAKHNHWTPFGHPQVTLRIKAPISIRTQMFKHKQGFVENEVSRRYVTDEPDFYEPQWRFKPEDNAKQGSSGFVEGGDQVTSSILYARAIWNATKTYNGLIARGIAPEQARFVLPQGMYTEWYWTGSLAAFARFYKLRSDPHAQWEIQQYAEAISEIIEPLFPVSWKCLTND